MKWSIHHEPYEPVRLRHPFAMMMLTVTDVVLRKSSAKDTGALELTEFMMVGLVLFALGRVERLDAISPSIS